MSYFSLPLTSNQVVPVVCFNVVNKMEKKLQNIRERRGEERREIKKRKGVQVKNVFCRAQRMKTHRILKHFFSFVKLKIITD